MGKRARWNLPIDGSQQFEIGVLGGAGATLLHARGPRSDGEGGSADATTATTTSSGVSAAGVPGGGWRSVPDGTSVKHQ